VASATVIQAFFSLSREYCEEWGISRGLTETRVSAAVENPLSEDGRQWPGWHAEYQGFLMDQRPPEPWASVPLPDGIHLWVMLRQAWFGKSPVYVRGLLEGISGKDLRENLNIGGVEHKPQLKAIRQAADGLEMFRSTRLLSSPGRQIGSRNLSAEEFLQGARRMRERHVAELDDEPDVVEYCAGLSISTRSFYRYIGLYGDPRPGRDTKLAPVGTQ
jgi:hypothetical protein